MKFHCTKQALQDAINAAGRAVASKSTIPALEGLLINADETLKITGFNLELGIICTIHLDPIVTDDPTLDAWRAKVAEMAKKLHNGIRIHDFRMVPGHTHTNLIFDIAAPFEVKVSDEEIKRQVADKISRLDPSYFTVITVDRE